MLAALFVTVGLVVIATTTGVTAAMIGTQHPKDVVRTMPSANHPVAVPLQWLPLLLATSEVGVQNGGSLPWSLRDAEKVDGIATGVAIPNAATTAGTAWLPNVTANRLGLGLENGDADLRGYCAKTAPVPGSCSQSSCGSWKLRTLRSCVARCQGCERCHFVSFSRRHRDCSWFFDCDLSRLGQSDSGESFRTFAVAKSSPRPSVMPPQPQLIIGMGVVPPRLQYLPHVLSSFARQTRPPDRILVATPVTYLRFNVTGAFRTQLAAVVGRFPMVEAVPCAMDMGPGSKLLCTLHRALKLTALASNRETALVLADDDAVYHPWALQRLDAAVRQNASQSYTYFRGHSLGPISAAHPNSELIMGQGVDLFSIPLHAGMARQQAARALAFFSTLQEYDERYFYHDDVWISIWLQDQLRLPICSVDVPDGAVLAWRSAAPSGNWHDAAGLFSLQDARLQRGPLTGALSQARRVWLSKTRDLSVPYVTPPCAPVCVCANLK